MLNLAPFLIPAASSRRVVLRRAARFAQLALFGACSCVFVACGASADSPHDTSTGGNGATGDGDGDGDAHQTITFTETATLELAPSGVAQITVVVSPRRRQTVMFEILSTGAFDGYLTGNSMVVSDDGTASVAVHAPSEPTEFQIRASLPDGEETRRSVSVNVQGLGRLRVIPSYNGTRDISKWYASAWPGLSCDQLESSSEKGPHTATSSSRPLITDIPAGTLLAVSVRGDEVTSGCSTIAQISTDEERSVEVSMTDNPVKVTSGTLLLTLGATTEDFAHVLDTSISTSAAAFVEEYSSDTEALLSFIRAELDGTHQAAFDQLIATEGVIQDVEAQLSSPTAISDTMRSILTNAAVYIDGPQVFEAELALNGLESEFTLLSAAGVDAEAAGFDVPENWQLEVQTGDEVSLGGELIYDPIRWLAEIAEVHADPSDLDPTSRVAQAAECAKVADVLVAHLGESPLEQCDVTCLNDACTSQAAALWERIKSSGEPISLLIGASGHVEVSGHAEIAKVLGSWVGRTDGSEGSLKGPLSGTKR
jgi:hypothetical protein